jgi:hypothetical protein
MLLGAVFGVLLRKIYNLRAVRQIEGNPGRIGLIGDGSEVVVASILNRREYITVTSVLSGRDMDRSPADPNIAPIVARQPCRHIGLVLVITVRRGSGIGVLERFVLSLVEGVRVVVECRRNTSDYVDVTFAYDIGVISVGPLQVHVGTVAREGSCVVQKNNPHGRVRIARRPRGGLVRPRLKLALRNRHGALPA